MLSSPDNGVPVLQTRSARRRRVVMPLLVLVVVGIIALLLSGGGQQTQLIGSGSTLAQPLIEGSITGFRNSVAADRSDRRSQTGTDWVLDGSGIDYEPVGSLGGIIRLADPEVDFAVSDYPLSADALREKNIGQFPVAVGAVAVVHNLTLSGGQALRLDAPVLAGIYLGRITRWNDPALAALNPGVALPDLAIRPVHRSDGSGSSFGLTTYLTAGSPDWARGPGTGSRVNWPTGSGAERSGGLIAAVQAAEGGLGYAEPGQAVRAGLKIAEVKNTAGGFTLPTTPAMQAAIEGQEWSGAKEFANPLTIANSIAAYPMAVAIYALVKRSPEFERDTRRTLRYLTYLIEEYDSTTSDLGYLPLPAAGAEAVKAYWADLFSFTP